MDNLYFNSKLEFKIDKVKGEKYSRLAAENGYKDAITLCKKNKINFINKKNYFENFEVVLDLHNSRTGNDRQELAIDNDYVVLLLTNGSKEECFKYLIKAKDQNYLPSICLLGKLYYDKGKYLLKKASELGSKEATEL
ncbi:hypothetical protein F8M41_002690 [Gigaspora margarita]|uniref:Uncharacterized protein n=1 Tax=Gigaspora margarita TaxID=4874 RepID=A0A8H4AYE6_GIGMA|nr:hypothetical protein F8M41_002690 [Gigaspora margarita]